MTPERTESRVDVEGAARDGSPRPDHGQGHIIRMLRSFSQLGQLPIWVRYLSSTGLVLICAGAHTLLAHIHPYPYLIFFPAIIVASLVFDRGSGFFTTFVSAGIVLFFFVEVGDGFGGTNVGNLLSVTLFTGVGVFAASVVEALRTTAEDLVESNEELLGIRSDLQDSLGLLEAIIEGTPDPIFLKGLDGCFRRVNTVAAHLLGRAPSSVVGKGDRDLLPEERARAIEEVDRQVIETGQSVTMEEEFVMPSNGRRWFLVTRAPWFGPDGRVSGVIGIARDIHDRRIMEEKVRAASEQKEVLLHDINHRVKNHLQSVMASLSLSRRKVDDEQARGALDAASAQLLVLARVYDRLKLQEEGEAIVDARDFVEELGADLAASLIGDRDIDLTFQVDPVPIEMSDAVSMGVVLNEALTNALKHAFPEERSGRIMIRLRKESRELMLEVRDDGVGMPEVIQDPGTGRRLIQALAGQLGGSAEWSGSGGTSVGTSVILRIPRDESRSSGG